MEGKREIPEKTLRPAASSGTIPTCENPGVARLGIEPGSSWWEANCSATAAPGFPCDRFSMYTKLILLLLLFIVGLQRTQYLIGFARLWERVLRLTGNCVLLKILYWLGCRLVSRLPGADWRKAFHRVACKRRHSAGVRLHYGGGGVSSSHYGGGVSCSDDAGDGVSSCNHGGGVSPSHYGGSISCSDDAGGGVSSCNHGSGVSSSQYGGGSDDGRGAQVAGGGNSHSQDGGEDDLKRKSREKEIIKLTLPKFYFFQDIPLPQADKARKLRQKDDAPEVGMERRWNVREGETGEPRENPPTNGIGRHDSHMRKSGSDSAEYRVRFAKVLELWREVVAWLTPTCRGQDCLLNSDLGYSGRRDKPRSLSKPTAMDIAYLPVCPPCKRQRSNNDILCKEFATASVADRSSLGCETASIGRRIATHRTNVEPDLSGFLN
ncbi:hypothetical protein PR048_010437 [Dryococelus australis]|uniref:Uncharacterized protein n=1 Tax=Dryococelus australis TaxID=614101 RepID=A0ABQ9I2S2_9NEOP|nr:hypothetical protein PR048_010437 [Dryococelus australis]